MIDARTGQARDPGWLADMLDERVKLVAITHVPTNGGLVNHYFNTEHEIAQLADAVQHMAERRGTTDGREGT